MIRIICLCVLLHAVGLSDNHQSIWKQCRNVSKRNAAIAVTCVTIVGIIIYNVIPVSKAAQTDTSKEKNDVSMKEQTSSLSNPDYTTTSLAQAEQLEKKAREIAEREAREIAEKKAREIAKQKQAEREAREIAEKKAREIAKQKQAEREARDIIAQEIKALLNKKEELKKELKEKQDELKLVISKKNKRKINNKIKTILDEFQKINQQLADLERK